MQLLEAKNIGPIYHFTDALSISYILSDNLLRGSKEFGEYYISFTRDKNFWNGYDNNSGIVPSFRINVDGTKLSNNHKIVPIDYFYKMLTSLGNQILQAEKELEAETDDLVKLDLEEYLDTLYAKHQSIFSKQKDEMEERLLLGKTNILPNFSSYVTSITLDKAKLSSAFSSKVYTLKARELYTDLASWGEVISLSDLRKQNSAEIAGLTDQQFLNDCFIPFIEFLCENNSIKLEVI